MSTNTMFIDFVYHMLKHLNDVTSLEKGCRQTKATLFLFIVPPPPPPLLKGMPPNLSDPFSICCAAAMIDD